MKISKTQQEIFTKMLNGKTYDDIKKEYGFGYSYANVSGIITNILWEIYENYPELKGSSGDHYYLFYARHNKEILLEHMQKIIDIENDPNKILPKEKSVYEERLIPCHDEDTLYFIDPKDIIDITRETFSGNIMYYTIAYKDKCDKDEIVYRKISKILFDDLTNDVNKKYLKEYNGY